MRFSPLWPDDVLAQLAAEHAAGRSWRELGEKHGLSSNAIRKRVGLYLSRAASERPVAIPPPPPGAPSETDVLRQQLAAAQRKNEQIARRLSDERRRRWAAEDETEQADRRARVADELADAPLVLPPLVPRGRQSKSRNRGIPVVLLSDWHVEEVVDPRAVNGRNEYNPAIAEIRAGYLFEGVAWQIEGWAKSWDISEAVVWLGGDLISGHIHEDLQESNALSPTEATLFAQELVSRGLLYLIERCPWLERITIPCNWGNHGRTTPRRRVSTAAKNSFEWLMYKSLEQRFADRARLKFHVADGAHLYTEIYGQRIRWTHGDDVRYHGGVGGLTIPLRKACDAWDDFEQVRHTVLGHYHQACDHEYAVVNGSLIGYNPYAISIKARWEPPRQLALLIDEEWGKKDTAKIYADPERKAA